MLALAQPSTLQELWVGVLSIEASLATSLACSLRLSTSCLTSAKELAGSPICVASASYCNSGMLGGVCSRQSSHHIAHPRYSAGKIKLRTFVTCYPCPDPACVLFCPSGDDGTTGKDRPVKTLQARSVVGLCWEALAHPEWRRAMVEEKDALQKNGTWELVLLLEGKGPTLLMMRERMTYRRGVGVGLHKKIRDLKLLGRFLDNADRVDGCLAEESTDTYATCLYGRAIICPYVHTAHHTMGAGQARSCYLNRKEGDAEGRASD
ncbi:unnamed protein product [Sphenostylis stenocarpa]|uniref:Uncharacterized protein n=1 Tax=Sphenostylis stenocarpa TaxID=92480 RepID=A0AA86SMI4_9FABA|nr:unnamed protein product [Sphenostylis stenocarpa]